MSAADEDPRTAEVAVLGAGPSGLAAAAQLAERGVTAAVLDEQARPGGQLLRRPPSAFGVENWLAGPLYRRAKAVLAEAETRAEIAWYSGWTVYGLDPPDPLAGETEFRIWAGRGDEQILLRAERVIVATGAYELPVPFPGWTLPGVMGAGGLQTFLKSQHILPGRRFVLAGSHPLQLVVAEQILNAGGEIALMAFSQSRRDLLRKGLAGAGLVPRNFAKFAAPARMLTRLAARRVRLRFNTIIGEAAGSDQLERVRMRRLDAAAAPQEAEAEATSCDSLGVCYGFVAATELARQAGAAWDWDPARGGWLIRADSAMRSSVPGLYAAGETTGVDGADAAIAKGVLAARAILTDRGPDAAMGHAATGRARRALRRELRFARYLQGLSAPPWPALDALPARETLVCRCECVSREAIEAAGAELGPQTDTNAIKLATRAGMGLCQGRLCAPTIARLAQARAASPGASPPAPFTARMPAKPAPIARVASLKASGTGGGG